VQQAAAKQLLAAASIEALLSRATLFLIYWPEFGLALTFSCSEHVVIHAIISKEIQPCMAHMRTLHTQ
jgi:hypothetical protein